MFGECAGRPYLIGAWTFLVAAYLQRLLHDRAKRDDEAP
jgi:hypothetical protein